jgi:hypothetical protein
MGPSASWEASHSSKNLFCLIWACHVLTEGWRILDWGEVFPELKLTPTQRPCLMTLYSPWHCMILV